MLSKHEEITVELSLCSRNECTNKAIKFAMVSCRTLAQTHQRLICIIGNLWKKCKTKINLHELRYINVI